MNVRFNDQYGFGRRCFVLRGDYTSQALGIALQNGTLRDGASNPRRVILIIYMLLIGFVDWSVFDFWVLSYFVLLSQLMTSTGWFLKAFVYHDYLYQRQVGKLRADWVFLGAMFNLTFNAHRSGWRGWLDVVFGVQVALLYYLAVLCCGWFAYWGHR